MPRYTEDRCSRCKYLTSRERLYSVTTEFTNLKTKAKKRVTTEWLCNSCMEKDPIYNKPPFTGPGHTSPSKVRANEIRRMNGSV